VVSIPPYSMVVFADPAEPQAGAPIAINMVLIDAQGQPVKGKTVTATFEGPSAQSPQTAKEDPTKLGPGRYQIDLPGLDAGTWKVTIAVGSEGSGTYSLDVAR
jgi:hypothetical protein